MEDRSGPAVVAVLARAGLEVAPAEVIPDDWGRIVDALLEAERQGAALVVTTGGTGLAARDLTPQATRSVIDHEVPGLAEQMRRVGVASNPMAMLSRGLAGVRGKTLVLNLPGSERGATESLEAVLPVLGHALNLLAGETGH